MQGKESCPYVRDTGQVGEHQGVGGVQAFDGLRVYAVEMTDTTVAFVKALPEMRGSSPPRRIDALGLVDE